MAVRRLLKLAEVLAPDLICHNVGDSGKRNIDHRGVLHRLHVVVSEGLLISLDLVLLRGEGKLSDVRVRLTAVESLDTAAVGVAVDDLRKSRALFKALVNAHESAHLDFGIYEFGKL